MSQAWANRQRRTNRLVRKCLQYLVANEKLNSETAYALCQLTWITNSHQAKDTKYIRIVKIPALKKIFGFESENTLEAIAENILHLPEIGEQNRSDILDHTGFTNFYKVYRNSSQDWMANNWRKIKKIILKTMDLSGDKDAGALAKVIDMLPRISSPSGNRSMAPEYLITPLVFSIDSRLRFPIINGSGYLRNLLAQLDMTSESLKNRHDALVGLIGHKGISDAADIDQIRGSLGEFINTGKQQTHLAKPKISGKELNLKDESDYETLKKNLSSKAKRIHNDLTNKLLVYLEDYTLLEGENPSCRYDVLVKDYHNGCDLLVEVKSSIEIADIRMAIGQLLDYHRQLGNNEKISQAVLLPEAPQQHAKELIKYAGIGLLFFRGNKLIKEWL